LQQGQSYFGVYFLSLSRYHNQKNPYPNKQNNSGRLSGRNRAVKFRPYFILKLNTAIFSVTLHQAINLMVVLKMKYWMEPGVEYQEQGKTGTGFN